MSACVNCKKSPPQVTLKKCAKCSETWYCSRDCQKADWKSHKKTCGKETQQRGRTQQPSSSSTTPPGTPPAPPSASTALSPPKGLDQPIVKPFTRLDSGTWMHDRPEPDVYRLLIDAYRMRIEDEFTLDNEAVPDTLYGGAPNNFVGFQTFLSKIEEEHRPLLPAWWNAVKRVDCLEFGRAGGPDGWYSLGSAVTKDDIAQHYGDPRFPGQLRMFTEAVYGSTPGGGCNCAAVRKMMVTLESGTENALVSAVDNRTGEVSHMR